MSAEPAPAHSSDDVGVFGKRTWGEFFRMLLAFSGPGYLIATGYVDPGNIAASLGSGSRWGYAQLNVTLFASCLAMFLQALSLQLGAVTGRDLAENCRLNLPWSVNIFFYILTEVAIVSTDIANLVGAAIAMQLLFNLRLDVAVALTSLDVLLLLGGWSARFARMFEFVNMGLVAAIGICFAILCVRSEPAWDKVFWGYLPNRTLLNPDALYSAAAVTGAICMPHSLVLGSHLVKLRTSPEALKQHAGAGGLQFTEDGDDEEVDGDPRSTADEEVVGTTNVQEIDRDEALPASFQELIPLAIRFSNLDSIVALSAALLINSSILITASASFYPGEVNEIPEAYQLFLRSFGQAMASLFAIALLISGIGSSMTGTLAGQVVMEGFLGPSFFKLKPWQRRLLTRSVAIVPAMTMVILKGESGISQLLVLSQVILAVQLPFTVLPLIMFTSSERLMSVKFAPSGAGQHQDEGETTRDQDDGQATGVLMGGDVVGYQIRGVTKILAWTISLLIVACNFLLLYQTILGSH